MSAGTAILIFFGVIFLFVIILITWAIAIYNGSVGERELVNEGWSSIDVQLKRRFNSIKNLVSVVKQYASHEAETLEGLTNARSAADTDDIGERASAEAQIGSALVNMLSVTEAYPDLKAEGNFRDLQQELSQLEDAIQGSRKYFNRTVRDYNTLVGSFPHLIIANMYLFREAAFFEIDDETQRQLPEIDFGERA